jgi:hypothetical protein
MKVNISNNRLGVPKTNNNLHRALKSQEYAKPRIDNVTIVTSKNTTSSKCVNKSRFHSNNYAGGIGDGVAVCYLCLDVGDDEADQPLRRDCACRGTDAGFVHLSCLTEYAAAKSKQARDMNSFIEPWRVCPGCHQEYQNEFAIDILTLVVVLLSRAI